MFTYPKCPLQDDVDDCHYQDEGFCYRVDLELECDYLKSSETEEETLQNLQNN